MQTLTITMAQINTLVGDIDGNTEQVIAQANEAVKLHHCDIVLFPELTLTGYPPEDLLLRGSLAKRIDKAILSLQEANKASSACWVVGLPIQEEGKCYNSAIAIAEGEIICRYDKQVLPNYQVFDECRYFHPGLEAKSFVYKGFQFALTICEDIWHEAPIRKACQLNIDTILNLNASPFHEGKSCQRVDLLKTRITECSVPIVYTNAVGGQDELVFDGGSMALNENQQLMVRADFFKTHLCPVTFDIIDKQLVMRKGYIAPEQPSLESIFQALVLSVKDYIYKNGFKGALLGLSGGIDSALTLAIAVEALGADRVMAIMMPFRFTSEMSKEDAKKQAETLEVAYDSMAIEPMYNAFMEVLSSQFDGTKKDTTEENLQARCRGVLLMAMSNKKGYLVLTTGNKSEISVGYSTLYGDMVGGFNPLKDIPKTLVFQLANYLNQRMDSEGKQKEVIPQRVIDRPPSAELSEDQKDEDSLPPYEILDAILECYVEQDLSAQDIIDQGFNGQVVNRVLRLVDVNEYKRRQAVVGTRISERGFGRDRRYPITNGWRIGE